MTNVTVFNHEVFGELRSIGEKEGEVWFVANDVAERLGYANPGKAVRSYCKGGVHFGPTF